MKALKLGAALALAAFLIGALVRVGGFDLGAIAARLAALGPWWVPVVAASAAQIALSAEKWRRVLRAIHGGARPDFAFCFLVSAVAAVLSQFLTVYVASIGVRALAARTRYRIGLGQGAASSGIEQVFDLMVLGIIALPTLLCIVVGQGLGLWIGAACIAAGAGYAAVARTDGWAERLASWRIVPRRLAEMLTGPGAKAVLQRHLAALLLSLSLVRFGAMFLRVLCIAAAAGFAVGIGDLVLGFSAGQVSQIASVTPGNLGIFEWSWSGVLAFRGHAFETAAELAIVIRIASFASFVAVAVLAGAVFVAAEIARPRTRETRE